MNFAQGLLLVGGLLASVSADNAGGDRTITKVIKMLQGMLVKSKADGEKDVKLFAKYKCYCDSNAAEKTKEIADGGAAIELLAGEIGALQGENGVLSTEKAELEMAMGDNERARATADSLRTKANDDFKAEEEDMVAAIGQMDQAIDTLAAIGADQTAAKASLVSQEKFMSHGPAKASLLKLKGNVKEALKAASVFLSDKQKKSLTSFIQAPFTGTYQSQSGEIVGILKNMRDTFKSNLASARASESAAAESHSKFTKVKEDEFNKMKKSFDDKDKVLGENDDAISTKKTSKSEEEASKADNEEFLAKLQKMCAEKTKAFEDRKMVRANEEAAVAEAVSILNSDEAFETFGAVKATTEGGTGPSLLQVAATRHTFSVREQVQKELSRVAQRSKSLKLAKIAVSLEVGNPFDKVIEELDAMVELIAKEEKADDEQKAWCDSEREDNYAQLDDKTTNKESLEGKVVELTDTIENAETGLKKQLADENTKLTENRKDQADEIETRGLENAAYQANIVNLVAAEKTLDKALKVLKKFYDWLHKKSGPHHYEKKAGKDSGGSKLKRIPEATVEELEEACTADPGCAGFNTMGWMKGAIDPEDKWYAAEGDLYVKVYDEENPVVLMQKKEPAPPEADFSETGQGQATDAVSMLGFILEETKKEEKQAHTDEEEAQKTFEDTMNDLKTQEAACLETIADLTESLASTEKTLEETQIDLEKTTKEKKALERYLLKIKPGCDFITENIDTRKSNREAETSALNTAKDKLKSTPAYKSAAAAVEKEMLGKCAEPCSDKASVECKACLAGTSVTGYCAANAGAAGC